MARGKAKQDTTMLAMALVGYELEKKKIDDKIKEIRAALGGKTAARESSATDGGEKPKRRKLSAAARKRISLAQKKRWAENRKAQS